MDTEPTGELDYFETYGYPLFYESIEEYAMPEQTDFTAMNDHDLLVVSVMQGNDTVKQQEKIIERLDDLNGTVKSDHAWIGALKWVMGFLFLLMAGTITATSIGLW